MNWKLFMNPHCFEHTNCIPEEATCLDFFNHWNETDNWEKGWERHLSLPAKRQKELENKPYGKRCLTSQQHRRIYSLFKVAVSPWSSNFVKNYLMPHWHIKLSTSPKVARHSCIQMEQCHLLTLLNSSQW